jgi:hypothetical protein
LILLPIYRMRVAALGHHRWLRLKVTDGEPMATSIAVSSGTARTAVHVTPFHPRIQV